MTVQEQESLIQFLEQYVTPNKKEQVRRVLPNRTRYVTVMLEDTYQSYNASAIMRSCEVLGIQDIHVIQNRNLFKPRLDISKGATKWVDIYTHGSTEDGIATLKNKGYAVVATVADSSALSIAALPLNTKIALLFGTELKGLTHQALERADCSVTIPMYGFTKSFNLSVSVALCVNTLVDQLRTSSVPWYLTKQEQLDLHLQWLRFIVPGASTLEKEFFKIKNTF